MAQEKYSKGKELNYGKLQMRKYLTGNNMSREQAVLAFKFRVRLIKVKGNFQNSYINNMLCPVCALEDDLQVHLISCIPLNKTSVTTAEYYSLFGSNEDKISAVIRKMEILLNQRHEILQDKNQ